MPIYVRILSELTQVVNQIIATLQVQLSAESIAVLGYRFKFYIQDGGNHSGVESCQEQATNKNIPFG